MASLLGLPQQERLKSKKIIQELFEKGSSFYLHPIKIFFYTIKDAPPAQLPQLLVSASKRNFKKAVDRNRIKRQLREAYRLNKPHLLSKIPSEIQPLAIGIMYVSKEKLPFKIIQNKLILAFDRFEKKSN